ncbi:hypothetical protein CPJCM30710_14300 [Clostridium polyendosporum]|uniref:SH3b domain-containing protein n=1 Tax=Clostridium polyendosporum TaxID=69208 RepID=A0A919RYT4_9CLOT|nr:SH3 domain-containing protein [Clostridium polyendosporum]GIM28764.1 hypothetical protein CPJCM30710_14300 [Clostridium polyendosporum]
MKKKVLTALLLSSSIVASGITKETMTVLANENNNLGKSVNVQKIRNKRDNTPVINGIKVNKQLININYLADVTIVPQYIVIHDTDNRQFGSNAMANRNYFANDPEAKASAHYTVDQSNIIQVLEDTWYGWHVGDGDNPLVSNLNTIGIELCVNPDNNFDKTLENGIALTKYLMEKYKIPASNVIRHYDVSRKICPKMMIEDRPDLWVYFKKAISSANNYKVADSTAVSNEVTGINGQAVSNSQSNRRLQGNSKVSSNSTSNNQKSSIKKGKVEVDSALILRSGPSKDYSIVRYLLNDTEVDIKEEYGDWYLLNANGIEGYAFKNYIKTDSGITRSSENKTINKKGIVTDISTNLTVRTGPSVNYYVVGYLLNDTEVDIKEEYGDWYLLNANGIEGYAFKNYIKTGSGITLSSENKAISKKGIVTDISTNLTVRTGPSVNYDVEGYLLNDTKVEITGVENGWYKVEFNTSTGTNEGYVNSDFVRVLN